MPTDENSRFVLSKDRERGDWKLADAAGNVVQRWPTKAHATAAGELKKAIGSGTVVIEAEDGSFQFERRYRKTRNWIREYGD
jgi:hypothetical protein